jgi:hypothetical protein
MDYDDYDDDDDDDGKMPCFLLYPILWVTPFRAFHDQMKKLFYSIKSLQYLPSRFQMFRLKGGNQL